MGAVARMNNEQIAAVLFTAMETAPPMEGLFYYETIARSA